MTSLEAMAWANCQQRSLTEPRRWRHARQSALAALAAGQPPRAVKRGLDAASGCVVGTIPAEDYGQLLLPAGFESLTIEITNDHGAPGSRRGRKRLDPYS